jgi:uncharacterized membrane protein
MRWLLYALVTVLLYVSTPQAIASASGTPLQFCNRSSVPVNVAVGYHSSGPNDAPNSTVLTGPFVSIGWWAIAPGACHSFDNPFSARYMFWYGFTPQYVVPKLAWTTNGGSDFFCVANYNVTTAHAFTFEDENASPLTCQGRTTQDGANIWQNVRKVDLVVNPLVNFDGT